MSPIGGRVDAAGLAILGRIDDQQYVERAQRHRPDVEGLMAEARRLHASGLSARDVATALRLSPDTVINWLARGADLPADGERTT